MKEKLASLRQRVENGLAELARRNETASLAHPPPEDAAASDPEPPVVARMVVEIRSDGSRTIARGGLEDVASGERTTLEARGDTPTQLALSLAKSMFSAPLLARQAVKSLREAKKPND